MQYDLATFLYYNKVLKNFAIYCVQDAISISSGASGHHFFVHTTIADSHFTIFHYHVYVTQGLIALVLYCKVENSIYFIKILLQCTIRKWLKRHETFLKRLSINSLCVSITLEKIGQSCFSGSTAFLHVSCSVMYKTFGIEKTEASSSSFSDPVLDHTLQAYPIPSICRRTLETLHLQGWSKLGFNCVLKGNDIFSVPIVGDDLIVAQYIAWRRPWSLISHFNWIKVKRLN